MSSMRLVVQSGAGACGLNFDHYVGLGGFGCVRGYAGGRNAGGLPEAIAEADTPAAPSKTGWAPTGPAFHPPPRYQQHIITSQPTLSRQAFIIPFP